MCRFNIIAVHPHTLPVLVLLNSLNCDKPTVCVYSIEITPQIEKRWRTTWFNQTSTHLMLPEILLRPILRVVT